MTLGAKPGTYFDFPGSASDNKNLPPLGTPGYGTS